MQKDQLDLSAAANRRVVVRARAASVESFARASRGRRSAPTSWMVPRTSMPSAKKCRMFQMFLSAWISKPAALTAFPPARKDSSNQYRELPATPPPRRETDAIFQSEKFRVGARGKGCPCSARASRG